MRTMPTIVVFLAALLGSVAWAGVYRVGSGDILQVNVLGEKEFTGSFRIASDGTIDYPYLRRIEVREKTVEDLEKLLTDRLKDGYLADPQVSVEVKEFHSQEVLLFGAVTRTGPYVLTEETRVLDLISRAGGITSSGGKRIVILRREGETKEGTDPKGEQAKPIVIDYYNLVHQGDFSQNVVLRNGDIINVPRANEVLISGNVGKPGLLKYEDGMTLLQAVMLAGDTTPIASPKNTYVLRKGEKGDSKIEVRLDKIKDGKEKDFALKADDVIVVPESFF
jgi:polysaccharide export outer membrane protein